MRLSDLKTISSSNNNLSGIILTKQTCPLQVYTVSWDNPTIFKPFAFVEDGKVQPWRDPNDHDQLTPWIYPIPRAARAVGNTRRITFNADLPEDERESFTELPYARFYRVLRSLKDNPAFPHVKALFERDAKNGPPVVPLKGMGVMQGVLYMHNGKPFITQPRTNILLVLSPSATCALSEVLTVKNEDGSDVVQDLFSTNPVYMLHFMKNKVMPGVPKGWNFVAESEVDDESSAPKTAFDARHIARVVTPDKSVIIPGPAVNVQSFRPWDTVIRVNSAAEQLELLCSCFSPEFIQLAFNDSEYSALVPSYVNRPFKPAPSTSAPQQRQPQQAPAQRYDNEPEAEQHGAEIDDQSQPTNTARMTTPAAQSGWGTAGGNETEEAQAPAATAVKTAVAAPAANNNKFKESMARLDAMRQKMVPRAQ